MKTDTLAPLAPGSLALRFRVEWRGNPARAVAVGVQCVVVVSVVGNRVVWTNGRRTRASREEFRHVSDRRELISLDALETVTPEFLGYLAAELSAPVAPAEKPASPSLPGAGAHGYGPRRRSSPWYSRDNDTDFPADQPDATNAAACCEHAAANA